MTEVLGGNSATFDPAKLAADGDRVADQLCELVCTAVQDGLQAELGQMPDFSEGVSSDLRDAMKLLHEHQEQIFGGTLDAIRRNFNPASVEEEMTSTINVSFADLSLQRLESLEENIAITRAANRAELTYADSLWELRQRTAWWRDVPKARVSDKSLSPQALCQAFFSGLGPVDAKSELRLLIFTQFDRKVLRQLHELYDALVDTLDQAGFKPLRVITKREERAAPAAPAQEIPASSSHEPVDLGQAESAPAGRAPLNLTQRPERIDPQTWQMLGQLAQAGMPNLTQAGGGVGGAMPPVPGGAPAGAGGGMAAAPGPAGAGQYSDQHLAQDIAGLLSGEIPEGWTEAQAQDLISRAATVGQAFNRISADPNLPTAIKPEFDRMRFEVLKSALKDPGFFRNAAHPMREMMDEMARLAATSRLAGEDERDRISSLLGGIHLQEGIEAGEVRESMLNQDQVSGSELETFLDEQLNSQSHRREALIEKARKVVSEEFWLQTAARNCSDTLRHELSHYWEPMMALRLLRHGVSSELWAGGVELLRRAVNIADPPEGVIPNPATVETWLEEFDQQLRSVGMLEERVNRMRESLGEALIKASTEAEPGLGAVASTEDLLGESRLDLLQVALEIDSWFEVYDRKQDIVRWLRAKGCNDDGTQVIFSQYSRRDRVEIPVEEFIEDLRRGVTAAVNPAPKAREALRALKEKF